jgi:tripartite-type tricarboxylate transporter receptor subunit TctC
MFKKILCAGLLGLAALGAARAEGPVRLVVAFPPGGPVDLVGRVLAEQLGKELGQPVIVENRAGANGNIAAAYVAKAPADGSVLFLTSVGAVAISPALYKDLPYDPARDFAPVSKVVNNATVFVVNPSNPAADAADFVKRSQAATQAVAIGSSGIGSIPHLTLEMFADASRANVLHVPYKGAAPVINDVMGNQVVGFFGDVPGLIGHIQGGKLKALGIAAPTRHPLLPQVRTLAEQGIAGVESNNWYGLVAPAATPPAVIERLNQAVRAALATESVRARLEKFGAQPAPGTPQELAALIASDREKWTALIQRKNIRPE